MIIKCIKLLVFILLLTLIFIKIRKYILSYKHYSIELDKLFSFLFSKNEYELLKNLGAINSFGVREKRHVPSRKIREYLGMRTDLKNEDVIENFIIELDSFEKSFITNYLGTLLLISLLLITIYCL